MKFGVNRFTENMENNRKDRPDMKNLPAKCCKNCEEWCAFSSRSDIGTCFHHSCCAPDGDSVFSWADDVCENHLKMEGE